MPTEAFDGKICRSKVDTECLNINCNFSGISDVPMKPRYGAENFWLKGSLCYRYNLLTENNHSGLDYYLMTNRFFKTCLVPESEQFSDDDDLIIYLTWSRTDIVLKLFSYINDENGVVENSNVSHKTANRNLNHVQHYSDKKFKGFTVMIGGSRIDAPRKIIHNLVAGTDDFVVVFSARNSNVLGIFTCAMDGSRGGPHRRNYKRVARYDESAIAKNDKSNCMENINFAWSSRLHSLNYVVEILNTVLKDRGPYQYKMILFKLRQNVQNFHGAGPSGWEPMTSQQQFQTLNQNRTPPPQAMSPHRLSTENSHSDLIIGQVINRDHGAPRDPIFIKQEPGLNTSQESDSSTSQESELNTSQESGLNTSQGPGLNTAQGSGLNTSQESGLNNSQGSGLNISQGSGLNTSQNLAPQPPPQAMPPPRLSTEGSLADLLISQAISAARGAKQEPGHNSSQGSGTNTSQGPGCNTLQGSGTNTLQGSGRKTSQESGTNTSEGSGSNTLQGSRTNILQESGCKTSQGPGTNTSQGSGSKIPEDSGTSTPQGSGGNTSQGPGTNTSQGSGRNTSQGPGSNTSQGSGSKTPEESGTSTPQGSGGNTSQGPGTNTSQGSGRNTSQGPGSNTSQRFGRNTSKGFGRNTSQGPGTNTSQRFGRNISKGFGRNTSQGPGTNTSQRFGRNASQGSGRNASQGPGRNCTYQGSWTNTPQGSSKGAGGWSKNK
ncbi:unnamed protein product, partial [Meganyctiphanes norvegica]